MTTETMTIHRGLAEIKVLENRILKAISEAKFCAAAKQSMKKLNGVPIEDYKKDAQSSLDSINDLIAVMMQLSGRFLSPMLRQL